MSKSTPRAPEGIRYEPIPAENGCAIALTIYPPKSFFSPGKSDYAVFVGGGGHGVRSSLRSAEAYLLECAKHHCEWRVKEAQKSAAHYSVQLARLETVGLRRKS